MKQSAIRDLTAFIFPDSISLHPGLRWLQGRFDAASQQLLADLVALYRFGGEEFVVILNLVNQNDAEVAFERFRSVITDHVFPNVGRVTVSMGIAHIDSAIMPTTLLDRADKALYHSKDNGRNRLTMYENNAELLLNTDNCKAELF